MKEKEYHAAMERRLSETEQIVLDTLSNHNYRDLSAFFEAVRRAGVDAPDARVAIWQLISEGRIKLDNFQPKPAERVEATPGPALAGR